MSNLRSSALAAARADGVVGGDEGGAQVNGYDSYDASHIPSRRGKWTVEEEDYANRLIHEFKEGRLPLSEGTTLRTFLSKVLNCDPMRISKKFVGANSIGKQIFRRKRLVNGVTADPIADRVNDELAQLEKRFLERVSMAKSRSRSGRSSSGKGAGGTSSGRQASYRQHADYDYGDRDDDDGDMYESGGTSGRRVRQKVESKGSSRQIAAAVQQVGHYNPQQDISGYYDQPHTQQVVGPGLKPVTSLEFLAMDGGHGSYQAQMQMKHQVTHDLSSPSQATGLPMESIGRSPERHRGLGGTTQWASVENLVEAATMIGSDGNSGKDNKAGGGGGGGGSGSNSSSSSSGGGGAGGNNDGESVPDPPAFRDLKGMGSLKRSAANEQLEKSGSSNNLSALAHASQGHGGSSSSSASSAGGNDEDGDSAVKQEEQNRNRSDSIVKFQSQVTGPDDQPNNPLKKGGSASIQNFMFLVANGDIPQPEENVLMRPLGKSSRQAQAQQAQPLSRSDADGAGAAANVKTEEDEGGPAGDGNNSQDENTV